MGVLDSLINSSLENERKAQEGQAKDAVFGDLLIKPKLFSLKKSFSDINLEEGSNWTVVIVVV